MCIMHMCIVCIICIICISTICNNIQGIILLTFENSLWTDRPTDRQTDRQTDRRTLSNIELLSQLKIPNSFLRTPQRTQPVFNTNSVCLHLTCFCQECTHFAWPVHTYAEACRSNTSQMYIYTVIMISSCVNLYCILLLLGHALCLVQFAV